jgi:MarR family 2-MHQ and catechol resistance regulon transcriptional repressor
MHLSRCIYRDAIIRAVKIADLIWLGQRLADAGREELRSYASEAPAAELILMGDLLDHPPSTISALAERTGYAQSRVSTAVSSMVERGWAQTGSDPSDGRRTLVYIPDDVRRNAEVFRSNSEAHRLDHLLAGRSPARRKAIIAALEELLDALREQAAGERPSTSDSSMSAPLGPEPVPSARSGPGAARRGQ